MCTVRQYRVVLDWPRDARDSGGKARQTSEASCAARELLEETGLRAEKLIHPATVLGSPGFTDEHRGVSRPGTLAGHGPPDEGEVVRTVGSRWTRSCTQSLPDSSKTEDRRGVLTARALLGDEPAGDLALECQSAQATLP